MADKLAQAEAKKAEGNAAFAAKEYEKAIGFYTEAIELDASNHLYYSNRSICLAETKKYEEAKADGAMCIKIDPTFVKGYHRKANAEFLSGDYDSASATVHAGLKVDPTMGDLKRLLQKIKAKRGGELTAKRRSNAPNKGGHDQSLQNELSDLSEQFNSTNTDLMEVKAKLEAINREMRRSDLTKDEIEALPEETPLYRSVGKMFMRADRPAVSTFLADQLAAEEKKKQDLIARQTYLQRRLQSQEANLKDLMTNLMAQQPQPSA
jgi:chaperonin cofactor prefoldin